MNCFDELLSNVAVYLNLRHYTKGFMLVYNGYQTLFNIGRP
jgi:hypothetical protein